jgi:hypothetical protein
MGYREFLQWQAYYALEPWGEWLNDLRFAQIAFVMASVWRNKDADPLKISDFVFQWQDIIREIREEAQGDEEDVNGWEGRFIEGLERRMARQETAE